ncbi:MAG: hypothetical protein U0183_13755 [Polyangiaceae bacterium]
MAHPLLATLSPSAKAALARAKAMPMSYACEAYASPEKGGAPARLVLVVGEAHLKMHEAAVLGRELVSAFELRGVETFQVSRVVWGRLLGALINAPRALLRFVAIGTVEGSTIHEARALRYGKTVELEAAEVMPVPLHVASVYLSLFFLVSFAHLAYSIVEGILPSAGEAGALGVSLLTLLVMAFQAHMLLLVPAWLLRSRSWAWLVHPAIAIVNVRDVLMAEGTVRMLAESPGTEPAVVVMGRAHLSGYGDELTKRGFVRVDT